MIVKFGTTNKKENSTAIPTFSAQFNCALKEGCSVISPTVRIDRQMFSGINYNCAYIPDFGRYYWISNIRFVQAVVYVDMQIDVLATYRNTIGNTDLYVTRSAAEYDGTIPDTMYPTTGRVLNDVDTITTFYDDSFAANYVIGISGNGGVKYYTFTQTAFNSFFDSLLSDSYAEQIVGTVFNITNPNLKVMIDPLQYINSVRKYPFSFSPSGTSVTTIKVGYGTITLNSGVTLLDDLSGQVSPPMAVVGSYSVKVHPQAASRGVYLNGKNYSDVQISTPFGMFPLDAEKMVQANYCYVYCTVDLFTGVGRIVVSVGNVLEPQNAVIISDSIGQIGVDVPVSQIVSGGLDLLSSVGSAVGVVGAAMTGNVAGAVISGVGSAASAIGSGIANSIPKTHQTGAQGTMQNISRGIKIMYTWYYVADDDDVHKGRPLCKVRKPNTLTANGGYLMCDSPDVQTTGTQAETQMVNDSLTSGIFFE